MPFHECTNSWGSNPALVLRKFVVNQRSFRNPVVAALMMFEAEVRDLIAQRVEEIIMIVMVSAEESVGLGDQMLIGSDLFRSRY